MIQYYRFQLLKRAWLEGPIQFTRQASLLLRDFILFRRMLVFAINANELPHNLPSKNAFSNIRCYERWAEVEPTVQKMLAANSSDFFWDTPKWLSVGFRMWAGFIDNQLAVVCWTKTAQQSSDFFFPLELNASLIWQTATANSFRGKGLYKAILAYVATMLVLQGNQRLYVACLESNIGSRRGIERIGFRCIGYADLRWDRSWKWTANLK